MGDPSESFSTDSFARRSADEIARVCAAVCFVVDEAGLVVGHGAGCASAVPSTVIAPPVGTCLDETVADADRERFRAVRERVRETGEAATSDVYRPAAHVAPVGSGDTAWETHFSPTVAEDGRMLLLVVTRDASWRAAATGMAGSLKRDLAHVLRLLTTGSLVTEATHDLMQPLGGLVSFADGALLRLENRESVPVAEARDWIETLRGQALEAAQAVRQLRDFARRSPRPMERLDGPAALSDAVRLVTAQARSRGVRIETERIEGTCCVLGRTGELRQLFVNLLLNGIEARRDAAHDAGGLVKVVSIVEPACWRVLVRDDGAGVPDAVRSKLFEPFESTKPDGLGLGLAIGRTIVEENGGEIRLASGSAPGAEFEVRLPRHAANESPAAEDGRSAT